MSVLIKGMKMPKDCPQCPLSHWNKIDQLTGCELVRRYVPESESSYWQSDTRPEWCPLVELPDHGDLIDRDALKEPMESVSVNDIEALPTIDAVPVKYGKWVDVMTEEWCTFDECKCSVCGVVEYFNKGWKKFSYCPNCGANMERSEE